MVTGDGVVGTWRVDGDRLDVDLFAGSPPVDPDLLEAEAEWLGRLVGQPLVRLSVRST